MRYFFTFKTKTNSEKFFGKELFYMRLLNKRMGKTYILHKNKCDLQNKYFDHYQNNFIGYVIEFKDSQSFSKFKLGFRKLMNPNLDVASVVNEVYSFSIDDDFDDQFVLAREHHCRDIKKYENVILYNRRIENIAYSFNNYIRKNYVEPHTVKLSFDDDGKYDDLLQHNYDSICKIEDFMMQNKLYRIDVPDINELRRSAYNSLFKNFQIHTI